MARSLHYFVQLKLTGEFMKKFFSKSMAVAAFAMTALGLSQSAFADLVVPGQFYVTGCVSHSCVVPGYFSGQGYLGAAPTVAGDFYTMTFGVSEKSGPTSEMSIYWNGSLVADVLNPANYSYPTPVNFTFNNLFATSSSTNFAIYGRQDPAVIYFSDLSITASNNVPEPESLVLVGLGLAGLGFMRRKAKKA